MFSAVAFRPDSHEAAVADLDQHRVLMLRRGGGVQELAGEADGVAEPVGLGFSADGRVLVVANRGTDAVLSLDLAAGAFRTVTAGCRPEGVFAIRGNAVFRLSEKPAGPLCIFDGDGPAPRVVLAPGLPEPPTGAEENEQ
jgi:hypothetical protein